MKKLLFIFMIGILAVSCGPSEKEIKLKQIADSTRVADSLTMVAVKNQQISDSLTNLAREQCISDSITKCSGKKKGCCK